MKVKTYLWVAAIASALFLGSCANDDAVNNDNGTAKTTTGTTFITTTDTKTRTHAKTDFSTKFDYFWDKAFSHWTGPKGDRIFVESTPGTWLESDLGVLKDTEGSVATFNFPGTPLTNSEYMVYSSRNRVNNDVIKIPEEQRPYEEDPKGRLDGDCGVGKATRTSSGTYLFKLHHKAAYAAVRWFCSNNSLVTSGKYKYYSVTISADEPMSGEYRLPNTEDGHLTLVTADRKYIKAISNNRKAISTSLSNADTVFFCIPPGTYHNVNIEVTVLEHGFPETMQARYYPVLTFKENELTPIQFDLKVPDYSNRNKFYLWGAKQHYWYGYESEQQYDGTARPDYPQAGDPNGRYANIDTYPLTADMPQASCPNVNETLWYIQRGNPIWDGRAFTYNGALYRGGVWFKKKAKISGFSASAAPDGVDYRPNNNQDATTSATPARYTNQDLSDYFFLPVLGTFYNGAYKVKNDISARDIDIEGSYWVNGPEHNDYVWRYFPALSISPNAIRYEYTGMMTTTNYNTGTPLWTGE